MPFGHDCEFKDFEACLRFYQNRGYHKEVAQRICGALKRDTEEKCRKKEEEDGN